MKSPSTLYFPLIDPLRGFAALSVLVYHVIETCGWKTFPTSYGLLWFKWGWMGVDIFFIISGFVITLSAMNIIKKHEGNFKAAAGDFLGRRIRRIVPLFYASIIFFLILMPEIVARSDFAKNLAAHMLFIHNWYPEFHRAINAPSWTLGAEFQFYVILILLIPFVNKRNLPFVLLISLLITFIWRACGFYLYFDDISGNAENIFVFVTQLPGMIEFFAFGMGTAFFVQSDFFTQHKKNIFFRLILLGIIMVLGYISMNVFMAHEKDFWRTAYAVIFLRTLLAFWFTSLIIFLSTFELSPLGRKIFAPFIYLGIISYGIYLIHWPILMHIKDKAWDPEIKLILTLTATIGLAALSWHFYEKKWLKKR